MDFKEKLQVYSEYSKGKSNQEYQLIYEDITIENFDFTGYELNDSKFLCVTFIKCTFDSVYCSHSNFSGSELVNCIFINNELQKATWDFIDVSDTLFHNLNAFRTDFFDINLNNCKFEKCIFTKCNFTRLENAEIKNVVFNLCDFDTVNFKDCVFHNVIFEKCKFQNTKLEEKITGVKFIKCSYS